LFYKHFDQECDDPLQEECASIDLKGADAKQEVSLNTPGVGRRRLALWGGRRRKRKKRSQGRRHFW
jgi:hypothetical protein